MKNLLALIAVAGFASVTGCAAGQNKMLLGTVGPQPRQPAAASTAGTLEVFSAYETSPDFNARDPYRPEYSDYQLFDADGKRLRHVHNSSDTLLQEPAQVSLPPGRYRVVARANGYGDVTIPVVIETGRDTVLHLEGGAPMAQPSGNASNTVQLPDGQIVGYKAAGSEPAMQARQGY